MEYNNMVQFRASANKKENKSNKVSNWNNPTTDLTYPTEKLVKDSLDGKTDVGHTHNDTEINSSYTNIETSTLVFSTVQGALQYNEPFTRINRALEHMLDNWEDYD